MLDETLHCRTSASLKVTLALHNSLITPWNHQTLKIQLYAVSATALMAYDYLLTLKDEVAELHYNNCAERDLTHQ